MNNIRFTKTSGFNMDSWIVKIRDDADLSEQLEAFQDDCHWHSTNVRLWRATADGIMGEPLCHEDFLEEDMETATLHYKAGVKLATLATPKQFEALFLWWNRKLSTKDIAVELSISRQAVEDRLKSLMKKYQEDK